MKTIQEIRDDFAFLDDWEDRYRYVIELGEELPPLTEAEQTERNKVSGCASQVWLVSEQGPGADPAIRLRGAPWSRGSRARRARRWTRRPDFYSSPLGSSPGR